MDRLIFEYMGYREKKAEEIVSNFDWPINIKNNYIELINVAKAVFYNKNAFYTSINSCEVKLKYDFLDGLCDSLIYLENNSSKEFLFVLEFLTTYYNGLEAYHDKTIKKQIDSLLEKHGLKRKFNNEYKKCILQFYSEFIDYADLNDKYIFENEVSRMLNNFSKGSTYRQLIIDKLIGNKHNIPYCVKHDTCIKEHKKIYVDYLTFSLENIFGYSLFSDTLIELSNKKALNDEDYKLIVNYVIRKTNELCFKSYSKEIDFINTISMIEEMIKTLNIILKQCSGLAENYRTTVRKCITSLLYIKQLFVSDNDYANKGTQVQAFKTDISKDEVDRIANELIENPTLLYRHTQIDFISCMKNTIKQYSESPLFSLVTRIHSSEKDATYDINIEEKVSHKNMFKIVFDDIGREYTESNPNLTNKLNKNWYEQLLIYLSTYYGLHQSLVVSILKSSEIYNQTINKLIELIGYDFKNHYAIAVANTLAIEQNIVKILQKNNIDVNNDGFENLSCLIEVYKSHDNFSFILNGLMFVNYILYEESGCDLRNKLFHGNMFGKDLDQVLIETFSGLLFVSWLLNE